MINPPTVQVANRSLKIGGKLVIKDFTRPENGFQVVHFFHKKSDLKGKHTFQEFVDGFKKRGREVPFKVIDDNSDHIKIETNLESAYEYMFRKDYTQNWEAELQEQYGYITPKHLQYLMKQAGFKIESQKTYDNDWITNNRIKDKVWLTDPETGEAIEIPKYDMVVVGVKNSEIK